MTQDHFQRIYTSQAAAYQRMIAAEDADGHLRPALEELAVFHGRRILDVGTGTGRLPLLLARHSAAFVGIDLHRDMLRENALQREHSVGRWSLVQGDMRRLPLPAGWAQVITAGWALGHLRGWFPDNWRHNIGQVLDEMLRVAEPGATIIVLETLTTGGLRPAPPSPELAEYYGWLEDEWGFNRQVISTDYVFASAEEAAQATAFFFGEALAAEIRRNGWARLPEWTGVWHQRAG
jgi:ubiquinone/menaquinone biosynthesis C-methylase UbiE